jgi:hypothetical protein
MQRIAQYEAAAAAVVAEATANDKPPLTACPAAMSEKTCSAQFIESFGRSAFRRPLTPAETMEMQQIYAKDRATNDYLHAIGAVAETMLASPRFYEIEPQGADPALALLDPYRLASRLSYFIWRSMPDEQLLAAAEGGQLASAADVEREARRLLADPRAHGAVSEFFNEWLSLDELPLLQKDPVLFPRFAEMSGDMATETMKFGKSVFFGDGQLETLLKSSKTWVNQPLAELYGQTGVVGPFQQAQLDPKIRAGILTQASFLSLTSSATDGSPSQRGLFIREKLLCQGDSDLTGSKKPLTGGASGPEPFRPPPNHDVTLPDAQPGQTNRDRSAAAIQSGGPQCTFGCHHYLDPIGYGFEEFDAIGQHRTTDNGSPVDASGELMCGLQGDLGRPPFKPDDQDGPFAGAVELSAKLGSSATVRDCVTRQWFRFGLSRAEGSISVSMTGTSSGEDECSIISATQATAGNLPDLVVAIATSNSFRYARW